MTPHDHRSPGRASARHASLFISTSGAANNALEPACRRARRTGREFKQSSPSHTPSPPCARHAG
eukprot:314239-Chlamydomonas_euryale.AAC.1